MRGSRKFVRGGPTLTTFFFGGGGGGGGGGVTSGEYHYNWAIIDPAAKHHLNGVFLACRQWPNIETGLVAL